MNKDEIKEKIQEVVETLMEVPGVSALHEKYASLSPKAQGFVRFISYSVLLLLLLIFPFQHFTSSQSLLSDYEKDFEIIKKIDQIGSTESAGDTGFSRIRVKDVENAIRTELSIRGVLPQQLKGIDSEDFKDSFYGDTGFSESRISVKVNQLNYPQIIQVGAGIQNIKENMRVTNIYIQENGQQPEYYDVDYTVSIFTAR